MRQQLEQALNQLTNKNWKDERENNNIEDITCTKCKKNYRIRSTYCSKGNHWVHYRCLKLTTQEIQQLEKEGESKKYTCTLCCPAVIDYI